MSWLNEFFGKKKPKSNTTDKRKTEIQKIPEAWRYRFELEKNLRKRFKRKRQEIKESTMAGKDTEFLTRDLKSESEKRIIKDPKEVEENLKALEKLKQMPRGMNNAARIAAIIELMGEAEAYAALAKLRWPKGAVCPTCGSGNTVETNEKPSDPRATRSFKCLDCEKKEGSGRGGFTDVTGIPEDMQAYAIRKMMLCWYLMGCCSLSQIARELGINLQQATKIVSYLHNEAVLAQEFSGRSNKDKKEEKLDEEKKRKLDTSADASSKEQGNELDLQSRNRIRNRETSLRDERRKKGKSI